MVAYTFDEADDSANQVDRAMGAECREESI
jgi:hypothetical protein